MVCEGKQGYKTDFQCLSRSEIGQQLFLKPKTNRFSSLVPKPLRKNILEDIF